MEAVAPRNQLGGWQGGNNVSHGMKTAACGVYGDVPAYKDIDPIVILEGRYVNQKDLEDRRKVAVIGKRVRQLLFDKKEEVLGQTIQVSGVNFTVVGVYRSQQTGEDAEESENNLFVPFTTFNHAFHKGDEVGWLSLLIREDVHGDTAMAEVLSLLKAQKGIHPRDSRAFGHWSMAEEHQEMETVFGAFRWVSFVFGGLALLAGVIGIMNIMLITIKERTLELGVRRALGATPRVIVVQIMAETLTLTALSGLVGAILGVAALDALDGYLVMQEGNGIFQASTCHKFCALDSAGDHDGAWVYLQVFCLRRRHCASNPWKPCVPDSDEQRLNNEAMKNGKVMVLLAGVLVVLVGTLYTLKQLRDQEMEAEATFATDQAFMGDVVVQTMASGSVQPRQEILIKPQVSGIVREVMVEPGDVVAEGDVLAEVMLVPDVAAWSNAESRLARAQITLEDAETNHNRNADLLERGVLAPTEAQRTGLVLKQAREELFSAEDNLRIVQEGVTARGGNSASNTSVRATVSGMVLEVPVKKGNSVIEANNFNEGTTMATVADMSDLQFVGKIDESEVEKLHEGMNLRLTIGAIEGSQIPATLEHIAPKGVAEGGAIQFEVKAAVMLEDHQFLRAGYSATAQVVLDERKDVLVLNERLLQYDESGAYVEVLVASDTYEKRRLELGLSDGMRTEILSGVSMTDEIKVWNQPRYE